LLETGFKHLFRKNEECLKDLETKKTTEVMKAIISDVYDKKAQAIEVTAV